MAVDLPAAPAASNSSLKDSLVGAIGDARSLLTGPEGRSRRKSLFALAAMAGVVGVGAAPPPLGLLQPVWADPSMHAATFDNPVVLGCLAFLVLFLILMGGFARSFTLALAEGIHTRQPSAGNYRGWLRRGAAHFLWSSALTLPLYFLLFGAEAVVTHDTTRQLTALVSDPAATEAQFTLLLSTAVAKFLLVLLPWTLFTLPAMVTMYELVPALMVLNDRGPLEAAGMVWEMARRTPRRLGAYLGTRMLLQLAGNAVALLAIIPCLVISSPVVVPLAGGGWWGSTALGGATTAGGAAVLTIGVLLAAVALYCVVCASLLPVSVFLFAFTLRTAAGEALSQGA